MIAEKVSIEKMLKKFWAIQECMDTAVHNILNGKEPDDEYLEKFDFGGFGIRHCGTEKINYLHVVTSSPHFSEGLPASTRGIPLSTGVTSPQSTGRFISPLKRGAFSLVLS